MTSVSFILRLGILELSCGVQVYASYKFRRDLAEAAKVAGIMGRSRQLRRSEAEHMMVRNLNTLINGHAWFSAMAAQTTTGGPVHQYMFLS